MRNWHYIFVIIGVALLASYFSKPGKMALSKIGLTGGN